jgi:hypothetical protein
VRQPGDGDGRISISSARNDGVDAFDLIAKPTPSQKRALDLLNVCL